MDTRHIRHFMALVECGSFARASEVVHLSQPALSRSIQELERQLGARLFDRGRFGVEPLYPTSGACWQRQNL